MTDRFYRFAVIGSPIRHSQSPLLHQAILNSLNKKGLSFAVDCPSATLRRFLQRARVWRLDGFSVTLPHKEAILPLLDGVSREAKIIGAVNCVTRRGRRWIGDNTDWQGFMRPLERAFGPVRGKRALVLGAGGAARAVVYGLCRHGIAALTVVNRHPQKAVQLVKHFQRKFPKISFESEQGQKDFDFLINATAVGLKGERLSRQFLTLLSKKAVMLDLIYHRPTPLLQEAKRRGYRTLNGLPMLVEQGVIAVLHWTSARNNLIISDND